MNLQQDRAGRRIGVHQQVMTEPIIRFCQWMQKVGVCSVTGKGNPFKPVLHCTITLTKSNT